MTKLEKIWEVRKEVSTKMMQLEQGVVDVFEQYLSLHEGQIHHSDTYGIERDSKDTYRVFYALLPTAISEDITTDDHGKVKEKHYKLSLPRAEYIDVLKKLKISLEKKRDLVHSSYIGIAALINKQDR